MPHPAIPPPAIAGPLLESDVRFDAVFEHAPIGMALLSPGGKWIKVNRALCESLGYAAEELLESTFQDITHPDDVAAGQEGLRQTLAGKIRFYQIKKRYLHAGGRFVPVLVNVSLVRDDSGEPLYFIAQILDITERTRAEEALQASEQRYHSLFEHMLEGYMYGRLLYVDGRACDYLYVEVNGAFAAQTGLKNVVGRKVSEVVPGMHEANPEQLEIYSRVARTGKPEQFETYVKPLDTWFSVSVYSHRSEHFAAVFDNITQRKRAELEVRFNEQRYRSLVEATAAIVWDTPASGEFEVPQSGWTAFTGQTFEELRGWGWLEAIHPDDRAETARVWSAAIASRSIYEVEHRIRARDGIYRHMAVRAVPVLAQDGTIRQWIGVHNDITARKQSDAALEEAHRKLVETSRQAGIAEFATGVLHNVGNVLNSINVSSACLADSLRQSKAANLSKVVELLREHETDLGAYLTSDPKGKAIPAYLAQLAERLAEEQVLALKELAQLQMNLEHIKEVVTTQQISAKAAGKAETLRAIDLVEDTLQMDPGGPGFRDIQVVKEFEVAPLVTAEKHKVLQILLNLVRNARQSCRDAGRKEGRLTLRVTHGGDRVRIAVSDNGVGIPPENLERMFSHGFTTKKDGHGFGLHSAVLAAQEMGGDLRVESKGLGEGATFTLELPQAA